MSASSPERRGRDFGADPDLEQDLDGQVTAEGGLDIDENPTNPPSNLSSRTDMGRSAVDDDAGADEVADRP